MSSSVSTSVSTFVSTFVSTLLFLCSVAAATEPMCYDWGESSKETVSVLEGEAGWLSCPLFSHPSVYNYTSTQSAGHNLVWFHDPEGHDLEQPITDRSRLTQGRERLWLQPAVSEDSGLYICMLSNKSSCSKMAVRLKVLRRADLVQPSDCRPPVAAPPSSVELPQREGAVLHCPDLQDVTKMADSHPNVTWYHVTPYGTCSQYPFWNKDREQEGPSLKFFNVYDMHQGSYFCTVTYLRKGKTLNFSRSINVTTVHPTSLPKEPSIMQPHQGRVFSVRLGMEARLQCVGLFPHLKSDWDIWWTVDGKRVEQLADLRFYNINSRVSTYKGDRKEESLLVIRDFGSEDLKRSYNCSVKNSKGFETRRAELQPEVTLPSVELGCGLGVTLVLMLLLFVLYHVFWLELLLIYRSWFGSDERHTDDKEYDVYISYARNTEDEQFVLSTLRTVLENELGYSVCIFDRDSLPGGSASDSVLMAMQRSRRLLFVISPVFLTEKSFSLLECRLGLHLQHGHRASIVAVVFCSVSKLCSVELSQLRQAALSTVKWRGGRSGPLRSRFWLRLRLALPVRPLALGRRLIDSTSSHSDLAALALQRGQRSRTQKDRTNQTRRSRSANHSRRDRQAPPSGSVKSWGHCRGEGPQHSRNCSGCAGFIDQVDGRGEELKVETEMQQVAHDRTDAGPQTAPPPNPDSTHETHLTPNPAPTPGQASCPAPDSTPHSCEEDDGRKHNQQQQMIGSWSSEERRSL